MIRVNRRLLLRTALVLLVPMIALSPAAADWTATGTFEYVDRQYDATGFTGVESPLPVRFADIEVVDANARPRKAVLATGATDANGNYSIVVPDSRTRDVYVRVLTSSENTADLFIDVRDSQSGQPNYYASATNTVTGHSPSTSVNFGSALIPIGQGGEPFNTFDAVLRGMDYLASLNGSRPGSDDSLEVVWGPNRGIAAASYCIGCRQINLRDSAGYDDTVIVHEMGHYMEYEFSASNNTYGAHGFFQCDQDVQLAWAEGVATYFGNSVLRFHNLPNSHVYLRTDGGAGAGRVVRIADLETDLLYQCPGTTNELNVFSLLWDIVDGDSTPDGTPGSDDAHDNLDLTDLEVWEVLTDHLPLSTTISLEDFWDGWFRAPIQNGFRQEMIDLADAFAIEFYEDGSEANNSSGQAGGVLTDGSPVHATLFSDPDLDGAGEADQDYYFFGASGGQLYVVETENLLSGADTYLEILDTDGQTVLASNDDRTAGDDSSRVDWVAPGTGNYYAHVNQSSFVADYGAYDLRITAQTPADNDVDGYDTTTDCNDDDPDINPGATEICDGVDQDCDSVIDNGFDVDDDGYTTCGGDCDDTMAGVNPGADEIPGNGIDDNCNGEIDEQAQNDIVIITKADWNKGPKRLKVEATSDQQPNVTLTLVGFGVMTWNAGDGLYTYTSSNGTPDPGTVTVTSSGGGSDTEPTQ